MKSSHKNRLTLIPSLLLSACILLGAGPCKARRIPARNSGTQATQRSSSLDSSTLSLALGETHSCVLKGGGVWCWGNNDHGQLGHDSTIPFSAVPVPVIGMDHGVTAIAAGGNTTCAIRDHELACWGRNHFDNRAVDWDINPMFMNIQREVHSVSVGKNHLCAIVGDNRTVQCLGRNAQGQLGRLRQGGFSDLASDVIFQDITPLVGVVSITSAENHTCAVYTQDAQQRFACWGNNDAGQLGISNNDNARVLVAYASTQNRLVNISQSSGGASHTCMINELGIRQNGISCMGRNDKGQLGLVRADTHNPTRTPLGTANQKITSGRNFNCVQQSDSALCWGDNAKGQLGRENAPGTDFSAQASVIEGLERSVTEIAAGSEHACAVVNRRVMCWGNNEFGQLGRPLLTGHQFSHQPAVVEIPAAR